MNIQGRILIVVNPKAVRLRKSGSWEAVQVAASDARVMLMETEYAGHARQFCRQRASEFDKVIVVGGDGLLMDVVNGVMGTDAAVGPLPAGSGSDFAKAIPGYPASLEALLASGEVMLSDVGKITFADGGEQYFLTEAGTGMDAACVRYIPDWLRPISASKAYDLGALRAIVKYKPMRVHVTLDEEAFEFERLQLLAVCNTQFFGDGMPIAPDAQFDDGVFHVFVVAEASRFEMLWSFTRVRKATHIYHPKAVYRSCRTVQIRADCELAMCVDGDLVERTPAKWEIVPKGLKVIAPGGG